MCRVRLGVHGPRPHEQRERVTHVEATAERQLIAETLANIKRSTGQTPLGWLGPGLRETHRTLDLLAELGVRYVADWVNDDQPYWLRVESGSLAAMPYSVEINDLGVFLRRGQSGADFEAMLRDQFDQLYEDSVAAARVLCIALHPFVTGVPYRARRLHAALAYMRERTDVWFATGSEILGGICSSSRPTANWRISMTLRRVAVVASLFLMFAVSALPRRHNLRRLSSTRSFRSRGRRRFKAPEWRRR